MPSADEDDVGAGLFTHKAHVFLRKFLIVLSFCSIRKRLTPFSRARKRDREREKERERARHMALVQTTHTQALKTERTLTTTTGKEKGTVQAETASIPVALSSFAQNKLE